MLVNEGAGGSVKAEEVAIAGEVCPEEPENQEVLTAEEEEEEEEEEEMTLEEALGKMTRAYKEMELQKQELEGKLLRMQADFDNFRRRTRLEKDDWRSQIIADFSGDLLPVIDNFARAMLAMQAAGDADQHLAGVEMIARQLGEVLQTKGVERIATIGQEFDPKWHEAIGQVPVEEEEQVNKIIDEVQSGYKIGEKLLRVAMVRVGMKS